MGMIINTVNSLYALRYAGNAPKMCQAGFEEIGIVRYSHFKPIVSLWLPFHRMPYELRNSRERKQSARHPMVSKAYYLPFDSLYCT